MIVVDTNLIAYLLLRGERTAAAERTYQKDSEWAAPTLWRSEFRNVLAIYLRRGSLHLRQALKHARDAETLIEGREFAVETARVLRLAVQSGCSAYDCEFVALAHDLGVPLITSDRKLLYRFKSVTVSPEAFAP